MTLIDISTGTCNREAPAWNQTRRVCLDLTADRERLTHGRRKSCMPFGSKCVGVKDHDHENKKSTHVFPGAS